MRYAFLFFLLLPMALAAQTATVNGSTVYQTIDGFGGENGGCWPWAMGADGGYNWNNLSSAQAAIMFSTTPGVGVGISMYRTDTCDDGGTPSTTTFPDLVSMQEAESNGASIFVRPQSPPDTLKYSGNWYDGTAGASGSCMPATNYQAYANYLAAALNWLKGQGVTPNFLDVQGEPNNAGTSSPNNGFGSCEYSPAALDAFIDVLAPTLVSSGLSSVQIVMPSPYPTSSAPTYYAPCLSDTTCANAVSVLSSDGYGYPDTPQNFASGKKWWMAETCDNGSSSTSFNPNMTDSGPPYGALAMAQNIMAFMNQGFSSWNYWELGYPDDGGYPNCNLIGVPQFGTTLAYAKRFYVLGNFSLFARPGWQHISATYQPQSNVLVTAFKNPSNGAFAIQAYNSNSGSVAQTFTLSNLSTSAVTPYLTDPSNNLAAQTNIPVTSGSFTATLTGSSVTTFVSTNSSSQAATPVFSPTGGTSTSPITYSISCATPSPTIYYTTNGATPTTSSPVWPGGTATASSTQTVQAICTAAGYTQSMVGSATYTINSSGTFTSPSCNPTDIATTIATATSAGSGNTVIIPSGTCTWTAPLTETISTCVSIVGQSSVATRNADGNPSTFNDNTVIVDNVNHASTSDYTISLTFTGSSGSTSQVCDRFSGVTVTAGTGGTSNNGVVVVQGTSPEVRLDNLHFHLLNQLELDTRGQVFGVIDDSLFDQADLGMRSLGTNWNASNPGTGDSWGDGSWNDATTLGSNRYLFAEHNTFNSTATGNNPTPSNDCLSGGRFVMRYNTFTGGGALQTHPTGHAGDDRGCRSMEIYGNDAVPDTVSSAPEFNFMFWSSGTGVMWGNVASGYQNMATLHSMLSDHATYNQSEPPNGWGYCGPYPLATGTATVSGASVTGSGFSTSWPSGTTIVLNGTACTIASVSSSTSLTLTVSCGSSGTYVAGSNWAQNSNNAGYACLDQPGRGQGDLLETAFPNKCDATTGCTTVNGTWANDALEPVLIWDNNWTPATGYPGQCINNTYDPNVLAFNRDIYTDASPTSTTACTAQTFPSAAGVGQGLLASRPTSGLTAGQSYWATDVGNWNQGCGSGQQGTLYTWNGSAWVQSYQPYTCPHPLTGSSTPTAATPVITPATESSSTPVTYAMSCSTPSSSIYYTTNGTTPTTSSPLWPGGTATASTTQTVQALCTASGYTQSSIASVTYTILSTLAAPTFTPGPGSFTTLPSVTISGPGGATICYTLDGSAPTATTAGTCSHGTTYTSPVLIPSSGTVLSALATEAGFANSSVTSGTYTTSALPTVPVLQLGHVVSLGTQHSN